MGKRARRSPDASVTARGQSPDGSVPVIGIGASAGGLEALSQLLPHMPQPCGAALVIVQHLDPNHESLLSGLLAKKSQLPVVQPGKRVRVQPDQVYVVPPACSLKLAKGFLRTAALGKSAGSSSLIDQAHGA